MNQVWLKSLQFHHKHLYPGEPTIDIDELGRAMKCVQGQQKNGFASYCIRSKQDQKEQNADSVPFQEMAARIEGTYKDTKDTIYIDAYFNLIDSDGDGSISYQDLTNMKSELGLEQCMNQKVFEELVERLNHETVKIGKQQFVDIIRHYI